MAMTPDAVDDALRWFRELWAEADKLAAAMKPDMAERLDEAVDVRREIEHLVLHSGLSTPARRWVMDLIDTVDRDWRRHVRHDRPGPIPPADLPQTTQPPRHGERPALSVVRPEAEAPAVPDAQQALPLGQSL